jgi:hypothetical protein
MNSIKIYILKLSNSKWYIGKTNNINKRFKQHINNNQIGSSWTDIYKPIKIEKKINGSHFDEDKYVIEYMAKYGIDNVRGGSFSQLILNNYEKKIINKMIATAKNKCYICGKSGHFANKCIFINNKVNIIK